MDICWQETQAKLVAIQEEYNLICQAWRATTNSDREHQLRDLASACLAEVQATIQQYGVGTQTTPETYSMQTLPRERFVGEPLEPAVVSAGRRYSDRASQNRFSTRQPAYDRRQPRKL